MDKTRINIVGKHLRRTFVAPDDLPFPMQKALEALANRTTDAADNDDLPQTRGGNGQDPVSTNVRISRNGGE